LSENKLTGTLPIQLSQLSNLNTLMVSDNNFDQDYITVVDDKEATKHAILQFNDTYVVERD